MEYFISICIILTCAIFFSMIFKRKIDETLKLGVLEIILIIYIAGLFDNLKLGVLVVEIIAMIQLCCILFFLCRQKDKNKIIEFIKKIITPGLAAYIGLCIIFILLNRNRIFTDYDEFNHWAVIVKNMFMYNTFGTNAESIITFNEYPPLTAVFQYFFLEVRGVYSEEIIITAHNILYFSVIIAIMKNIEWNKNVTKCILILPIIIFLPMLFIENFYLNILVDGILGVLFGLAIYEHYEKDDNIIFKYIKIGSSLLMLSLIKTSGIALTILALIIIFIKILLNRKKDKKYFKKELLALCVSICIIVIFVGTWYLKVNNVGKEWDFSQYIKNSNKTQEQKDNILKNYIYEVFLYECITDREMTIFICTLGIIYCNFFVLSKTKKLNTTSYKYYSICMIVSILVFLIGLLMSYIAIFTNVEAEKGASLWRYSSTVFIANMIFQILVLFSLDIKIEFKTYFIIYTIIIFFLPIDIIQEQYVDGKNYKVVSNINRDVYTTLTKYKNVLDENDSIYFIAGFQNNIEVVARMNRYEIMPTRIADYSNGRFLSEMELKRNLPDECTHIYIYRLEDEVKEIVKPLFQNMEVRNDTLYKIVRDDKNLYFELVDY